MALRRFLIILASVMVIILAITVWFFPSNDDFRVENPFWNGTSDVCAEDAALPLPSLSDLPPLPQGATLIFIPYVDCNAGELKQIKSFVTRGGRLVLADDYGYGNRILAYLGLTARFSGGTLLDPLLNYKNQYFPKVVRFEPGPPTSPIENMVLNHATSLSGVAAADVLASSSSFSFLDFNDNGLQDEGEPTGPLPVISHHELGSGEVIIVADPSIFTNGMMNMAGNRSFIENIITAHTTGLYIDQSHLPPSELHQTKNWLVRARDWLSTPPASIGVAALALVAALQPIWYKKKEREAN